MKNILSLEEINKFKEDGAVILRNKFDEIWIAKLRLGIQKAKNTPSPRLVSHTKEKDQPAYYEDFGLGIYLTNLKILFLVLQQQRWLQNYWVQTKFI